MRRLNRATAGIISAGMLLTLAACGGDDPGTGTEPTPRDPTSNSTETTEPTPTEPTPTEPTTDEDKAAAAFLGYLDVRDQAYATGRISKKLNKYATGREHLALQQFITQLTTSPQTRFEGTWSHEVLTTKEQQDGAMSVTECEDGTNVNIVRSGDGQVLPWIAFNGKELPRRLKQTYRVSLADGAWKVESKTSTASKVRTC